MDQEKIGKFLSELRKEHGMTQQQLADAIGVSNKTVSKWECGKGVPEISSIMPLCQTLQINVNELLSGEHLPEEGYSKKAEENMMELMQETENSKRKSKNSLAVIFVTVIAVLLCCGYTLILNGGIDRNIMFIDMPALMILSVISILFLVGTNLGKPFLQSFMIVAGKKKAVSETELLQSKAAIKLVSNILLGMGVFESCAGFIVIMWRIGNPYSLENMGPSIAVALIGIIYGLIGFLLLLPVRMKLEVFQGQ